MPGASWRSEPALRVGNCCFQPFVIPHFELSCGHLVSFRIFLPPPPHLIIATTILAFSSLLCKLKNALINSVCIVLINTVICFFNTVVLNRVLRTHSAGSSLSYQVVNCIHLASQVSISPSLEG